MRPRRGRGPSPAIAVAPPGIPRIGRCLALGQAIGRFLDALARRTFGYSIYYLMALFAALLLDHWV